MFKMLNDLTKATAGAVIETPIAVVKDIATLGGSLTDEDEPYTATSAKKVIKNISNATDPE